MFQSSFFLFWFNIAATIILLLLLPLVAVPALAALHTCDTTNGGHLQLTNQSLGAATFSVVAGCTAITISACSADSITFPALTNIAISINGVACSVAAAPPGTCVSFSTVSGGSIGINGMSRTITGTAAGVYSVVQFSGGVTSILSLTVTGLSLTTSLSTTGADLFPLYFPGSVAGSGVGSAFNFSGNAITAGSTWVSTSASVILYLVNIVGTLSGFEMFVHSKNSVAGMSIRAGTDISLLFFIARAGLSLAGSAASSFTMERNSIRGVSLTNPGTGFVQVVIFHAAGAALSGISDIIIDGLDATQIYVSSTNNWAHFIAVHIPATTAVTMSGAMRISGVIVGGTVTPAVTNAGYDGVAILDLRSTTISGMTAISVSGCAFDSLNITSAGANFQAVGYFLRVTSALAVPTINVNNNQIIGISKFHTTGSGAKVLVVFAQFDAALSNVQLLSAKNNFISPDFTALSALGAVELYNVYTLNSITGSAGATDVLDVSNTDIHGAATATTGYVCVGVVSVAATKSVSGFETVLSSGSLVNVAASAGAAFGGTHGTGIVMVQCGSATVVTSTTTTTTSSTTSSTTTSSSSTTTTTETSTTTSSTTTSSTETSTTTSTTTASSSTTTTTAAAEAPTTTTPQAVPISPSTTTTTTATTTQTTTMTATTAPPTVAPAPVAVTVWFQLAPRPTNGGTLPPFSTTQFGSDLAVLLGSAASNLSTLAVGSPDAGELVEVVVTAPTQDDLDGAVNTMLGFNMTQLGTLASVRVLLATTSAPSAAPTSAPLVTAAPTSPATAAASTATTTTRAPGAPASPAPAPSTAATTTSQQPIPPMASLLPGMPPPGLLITLQQPKPGETTVAFDKDKFRKTLSKEIDYPEPLIAVSDPDGEGKVKVALLGANLTEVDAAIKKAETLDQTQMSRLGASAVINANSSPPAPFPLWVIILVACMGALLLVLVLAVIKRRRDANKQTFIHTAMSRPDRDDGWETDAPMLDVPMLGATSGATATAAFGASQPTPAEMVEVSAAPAAATIDDL